MSVHPIGPRWHVVGLAGSAPRLLVAPCSTEAAQRQAQTGEVVLSIGAPGDYVIAADGRSVRMRPKSIAELRAAKWARVKAIRAAKVGGGVLVAGIGRFDTDAESRMNIREAASDAAQAIVTFSTRWKMADNSIVTLNGAQMVKVASSVRTHVNAAHQRAQELGVALEAATTAAQIGAIDVEAGWS